MAWRVTVRGFDNTVANAHEAIKVLQDTLYRDGRTRNTWAGQLPEFCNGIKHFGEEWDNGDRFIMIRFMDVYPQAIEAFNEAGLEAVRGG